MTIKLIAIDIDDTLLNSAGQILPSTVAAIKAVQQQGIKVVLCTGRPLAGAQHFLKTLGLISADQYAITFNGAALETTTGQVIARHLIDNQYYRTLTAFAKDHHVPFNVLDEAGVIYTADHDVDRITVIQAWENHAGLLIRQPAELPSDFKIAKGLFVGTITQLDQIEAKVKQRFGQDLYVVRAGGNFLELMSPQVNKGNALLELASYLQIERTEIMAIGDEQNDLAMFKVAGTAIAMGNSTATVKAQADYVTATNDQNGIAQALAHFGLTEN
ncbi:Cof-type HAD-IIB family hydrolase [Lapidilactobacillus luobeiensis]|uniref:Cof-type HAD-IIB family hydrolase n=1 Tax=Lapidilactobacillus luobeiensis TaxID=2950371 RepID=UPI0021C2FC18|nr:Cof-type HAD-IIB family hydrolase [Lapidilactobacillus luobeiensis]